jgi:hypothetical protein
VFVCYNLGSLDHLFVRLLGSKQALVCESACLSDTLTRPDEHVIMVGLPLILPSFGEDPFGQVASGQLTLCSNTQSIQVEESTGPYPLPPQNRLSTAKSVWDPSDDQFGYYFASGHRSLSFKRMKIRPNNPGTVLAESDELVLFLLYTSSHDCL